MRCPHIDLIKVDSPTLTPTIMVLIINVIWCQTELDVDWTNIAIKGTRCRIFTFFGPVESENHGFQAFF